MSPEASPGGFRGAIGPRRPQEVEEPPGDPRRPQEALASTQEGTHTFVESALQSYRTGVAKLPNQRCNAKSYYFFVLCGFTCILICFWHHG